MSDHIGLQHTFLAAQALGAGPSLKSSGQRVVFEMGLETEIAPVLDVPQDHLRTSLLARFPRDLESGFATLETVMCRLLAVP